MGNEEMHKIEKEIKYKHSKKEKPEIDNDLYIKHLSILNRYINYNPDFLNISLISTDNQIKNSILDFKNQYIEDLINIEPSVKFQSFEEKQDIFRLNLQKLKIDWTEGPNYVTINRDKLIESSIEELSKVNLYREIKVKFKGEEEGDAGGIMREWLTSLFKEIQKPENKLFTKADTTDFSLKVYNDGNFNKNKLNIFDFIGKIFVLALLDELTINSCFNIYIYKIILDEPVDIEDLVFIDTEIYHSIKKLQNLEDFSNLELYFAENEKDENGNIKNVNLILDGANIPVTKDNVKYYFQKKIEYIMNKDRPYINHIKKSIFSYIPESLIKIFTANELELILNGQPFIDVSDWIENTIYEGYEPTDQIIINFWNIVKELSQDKLSRLLQFSTGSTRVPVGGFKSLMSNRGNFSPFSICKMEYEKGKKNYIKARTCFNRINLPNFPDEETLLEGINFVIDNEILGFGIE
jgi:E3 ubiquitin-protein ligase NEDD4